MALFQRIFKHRGSQRKTGATNCENSAAQNRRNRKSSRTAFTVEPDISSSGTSSHTLVDELEDEEVYGFVSSKTKELTVEEKYCCGSPPFCKENFRLVIFRESDRADRRLLFDSKSVRLRKTSSSCPNTVDPEASTSKSWTSAKFAKPKPACLSPTQRAALTADKTFEFSKHQPDTKLLGEMIFGAVAMAYKGETLKLHYFKRPNQIMLTKVFPGPKNSGGSKICRKGKAVISENGTMNCSTDSDSDKSDSLYSTITSLTSVRGASHGKSPPTDVPDRVFRTPRNSFSSSRNGSAGDLPDSQLTAGSTTTLTVREGEHEFLRTNSENGYITFTNSVTEQRWSSKSMPRSRSDANSMGDVRLSVSHSSSFVASPRSIDNNGGSPIGRIQRIKLSRRTSMDNGIDRVLERRRSSLSLGDEGLLSSRRRGQFGLAILFNFDESLDQLLDYGDRKNGLNDCDNNAAKECFRRFLLSHMHLIEIEMTKLQKNIGWAAANKQNFLEEVYSAWSEFCASILVLYNSPRLVEPVWISLMGCCQRGRTGFRDHRESLESKEDRLIKNFMAVFGRLVQELDVKMTNFFLSRVLTAVLKNHLSWVASVAPSNKPSAPMLRYQRRSKNRRSNRTGLDRIGEDEQAKPDVHSVRMEENCAEAASNPYNPFWAQYLDVVGAVGYPVKSARTLILGEEKELVMELLYLLSYFIRCSEIKGTSVSASLEEAHFKHVPVEDYAEVRCREETERQIGDKDVRKIAPPICKVIPSSTETCDTITIGFEGRKTGGDENCRSVEKVPPSLAALFRPFELDPVTNGLVEKVRADCTENPFPMDVFSSEKPDLDATLRCSTETEEATSLKKLDFRDSATRSPSKDSISVENFCEFRRRSSSEARPATDCKRLSIGSQDSGYRSNASDPNMRKISDSGRRRFSIGGKNRIMPPTMEKISDGGPSSGEEKEDTNSRPSFDSGIDTLEAMKLLEESREFETRTETGSENSSSGSSENKMKTTKRKTSRTKNCNEFFEKVFKGSTVETFDRQKPFVPDLVKSTSIDSDIDTDDSILVIDNRTDRWPTDDLDRSMLAGSLPTYGPHFAISGAPVTTDIYSTVWDELRAEAGRNLDFAGLDCEDGPAVCVVANTEDWSVKVLSSDMVGYNFKDTECACPAQSIVSMVENTKMLSEMNSAPDFCLMHLEDCLSDIYAKSVTLAETLEGVNAEMDMDLLCRLVGCDWSDWPLLKSVASVHSPEVMSSLLA